MIVRVLSDDLTGALDTAAVFAGRGAATVTWGPTPGANSLAHCLNTRSNCESSAMAAVAAATRWLTAGDIAFKKCDSRLRGHVAAELRAMLKASPKARAVVAPSFPAQGRIMSGGRVFTKSRRARATEPVDLAAQLAVTGIPVRLVRPGEAIGDGITIADAVSDADLDCIVDAGLGGSGGVLWCGSAGLAGALVRRLGAPSPPTALPAGACLVAVGTHHRATLRQVAALRSAAILARDISLAPIASGPPGDGLAAEDDTIAYALQNGGHVLATLTPEVPCGHATARAWIAATTERIAKVVPKPDAAIVTGGATLLALVEALGASAITLDGLYTDGVPVGRINGGAWDGTIVVSKSGGFGTPSLLVELLQAADRG